MSSSNPPARGVRVDWNAMPAEVRGDLEERLGSRVKRAATQSGGFSPGVAVRLELEDGGRAFIKAVSEGANPDSHNIYRQEARILAALPRTLPVPRLRWLYDNRGWVALCLDDIDGRHPHEPWTEGDLSLVIPALREMAAALTPSPIDFVPSAADEILSGWRDAVERRERRLDPWAMRNLERLAKLEAKAAAAARGQSLVHFDTRADNLLVAGDRVYVLDWPWARVGAAWIDWVAMAPSVEMQGGPDCEEFVSRFEVRDVPKESIDAVVCSLAGYFCVHALEPPPPGIPTVRAFQAAQGVVALRWLRERTGWS